MTFVACDNIYIVLGYVDVIWGGNSVFREWTGKMVHSFFVSKLYNKFAYFQQYSCVFAKDNV
jgi:hypothetical protein